MHYDKNGYDGSDHNSDDTSVNDIRSNSPSNTDAMGSSKKDNSPSTKANAIQRK